MALDLSDALNVVHILNGRLAGTNREHYHVGIASEELGGLVISYRPGDVVVFKREIDWDTKEYKGKLTVEKPYSKDKVEEMIDEGRANILTHSCTVCVPEDRIEKVIFGNFIAA